MGDIALCIPRISVNFTKNYINEKIRKLNWGFIENINEIPLLKEKDFKRIVIKLKWNNNSSTIHYKNLLNQGNCVKLVYDTNLPWFWRINKFN